MFPDDTFEEIIFWLQDDGKTLCSCSLVSRIFAALTRKYVFSTIVFRPPPNNPDPGWVPPTNRFHQLLQQSPNLSSLVHSVVISESVHSTNSWIVQDELLPSIMQSFTGLLELVFHGHRSSHWLRFPQALQKALVGAMQLPTLTRLDITHLAAFPWSSTSFSLALREVTLSSIRFPETLEFPLMAQKANHAKVRLRSLEVHLTHTEFDKLNDWFLHPFCIFDASSIRRLNVSKRYGRHNDAVCRLIEHTASSLEELVLSAGVCSAYERFNPWEVSPRMAVNLGALPRLRSLLLRIVIDAYGSSLPGVIKLFEGVTSSSLTHVSLDCSIDTRFSDRIRSEWKAVDVAIAALDCVQSVCIKVFSNTSSEAARCFALGVEESLTRLGRKGITVSSKLQV